MPQGKIEIVSKYIDLSSDAIKQSFQKSKTSAVDLAKEFDSLKRSIRASMSSSRDAIVKAMQESSTASKKHTTEIQRHTRYLGESISSLAGKIGSLRNMLLVWMFALRPIINIVKSSTQALIEQEDAVKRINAAMGIQGTQSEFMSNKLINLSKAFQQTTRYGDDAILQVMEKLITLGNVMPSQIGNVTQAVLDLSAATGRDLNVSAEILARASQGITTGLRRQGIVIDENIPKGRVFATVLEYINKNMGGRAQKDIESYSGRLAQMSNAFNDAKESLGLFIAETFKLKEGAESLKYFLEVLIQPKDDLAVLTDRLLEVNKGILKFTEAGYDIEKLAKLEPIKIFGFDIRTFGGIEEAKRLLAEREAVLGMIQFLQNEKRRKEELEAIKADEEAKKQLKLQKQEDFTTQYRALSSRRLEFEKQTLEEDYKDFLLYADNKLAVEEWYQERLKDIRIQEKTERRKHPALESAEESKKSLDDFLSKEGPAAVTLMTSYAKGMENALTEGFINVIKGNFEGLSDIVKSFGDMMLETIMRIVVQSMLIKIGFASFMGVHTGGYIQAGRISSAGYSPQKRFHSGGEVSATLLEGEYVLNRKAVRNIGVDNLDKLNRGETSSGTVINNYYIQTIDERSFRERLQEHGDIYTGASERGIKDNTSLRKTSQRFG